MGVTSQKNSFPLREQNQEIQETSSELLIVKYNTPVQVKLRNRPTMLVHTH